MDDHTLLVQLCGQRLSSAGFLDQLPPKRMQGGYVCRHGLIELDLKSPFLGLRNLFACNERGIFLKVNVCRQTNRQTDRQTDRQ